MPSSWLLPRAGSWMVDRLVTQDMVAMRLQCPRPGPETAYGWAQHQWVTLATIKDLAAPFGPSDKVHGVTPELEMRQHFVKGGTWGPLKAAASLRQERTMGTQSSWMLLRSKD